MVLRDFLEREGCRKMGESFGLVLGVIFCLGWFEDLGPFD